MKPTTSLDVERILQVARIHPTAIVHPEARVADDVEIGAYAVVGAGVVVGRGSRLHAHAIVEGPARIGERVVLHSFTVVGGAPQHKRDQSGGGELVIGDDNVLREHVTVHRGTGGGATRIGNGNLFMVGSHVAHDVTIGSSVTVANQVQLAGHVVVEDHVTFGGLAGVVQFARIGEGAFVAAGAMVERDVPPFVIVQGDRARVRALNVVGLRRRGIDPRPLAQAFRAVFVAKRSAASLLTGDTTPEVVRFLRALAPTR